MHSCGSDVIEHVTQYKNLGVNIYHKLSYGLTCPLHQTETQKNNICVQAGVDRESRQEYLLCLNVQSLLHYGVLAWGEAFT